MFYIKHTFVRNFFLLTLLFIIAPSVVLAQNSANNDAGTAGDGKNGNYSYSSGSNSYSTSYSDGKTVTGRVGSDGEFRESCSSNCGEGGEGDSGGGGRTYTPPPPPPFADLVALDVWFIETETGKRVLDTELKSGVSYTPVAEYRNQYKSGTWYRENAKSVGASSISDGANDADGRFPTMIRIDTAGEAQIASMMRDKKKWSTYNGVNINDRGTRFSYVSVDEKTGPLHRRPFFYKDECHPFVFDKDKLPPVACGDTGAFAAMSPNMISEAEYQAVYAGRTHPLDPSITYTNEEIFAMAERLREAFPTSIYDLEKKSIYEVIYEVNPDKKSEKCSVAKVINDTCDDSDKKSLDEALSDFFSSFGKKVSDEETYKNQLLDRTADSHYFTGDTNLEKVLPKEYEASVSDDPLLDALYKIDSVDDPDIETFLRLNRIREQVANVKYIFGESETTFSHARRVERYRDEIERYLDGETGLSGNWWQEVVFDVNASHFPQSFMSGFFRSPADRVGTNFTSAPEKYLSRFAADNVVEVEYDPVTFDEPGIFYIDAVVDPGGRLQGRWFAEKLPQYVTDNFGITSIGCGDRSGCVAESVDDRYANHNYGSLFNITQKTFEVSGERTNSVNLDNRTGVKVGGTIEDIPYQITNNSTSTVITQETTYDFFIGDFDVPVLSDWQIGVPVSEETTRTVFAEVAWTAPDTAGDIDMQVCVNFTAGRQCDPAVIEVSDDGTGDGSPLTPPSGSVDCIADPTAPGCTGGVPGDAGGGAAEITVSPNYVRQNDVVTVEWFTDGESCTLSASVNGGGLTTNTAPETWNDTPTNQRTYTMTCPSGAYEATVNVLPTIYES